VTSSFAESSFAESSFTESSFLEDWREQHRRIRSIKGSSRVTPVQLRSAHVTCPNFKRGVKLLGGGVKLQKRISKYYKLKRDKILNSGMRLAIIVLLMFMTSSVRDDDVIE